MTKYVLFIAFAFFQCSSLFGQITHFPFDTDFNDVVNDYNPSTFGNPEIITDDGNQVLQLEGDEYLSLPIEVYEEIDPDQNLEIQIKFKITNTYTDAPYAGTGEFGEEGKRVLISNKQNDIFTKGFDIFVAEVDEEYRVLMSFGDDTETGGTFIFNETIEEGEWVELKLILRLNNETPSIAYKINGYYSHFPLNYLDVALFKESLNTQQIWIGTDEENSQGFEGYAFAETSIDYIKIFNPPFVGNSALVANAINALANHVNASAPLEESEQKSNLNTIVNNWDDNTYTAISADILNYIATYEQEEGTVFEAYGEYVHPKEVEVPRSLQFMLLQWMTDNLYTSSNAANMEGISFLDHQILPGIVNSAAPRTTGSATIDGTYNTNPGYFLNQQDFVIRPTGYYAAPGELVEITFPEAMLNQGVKVHVGAHFIDIREDFVGFQRFPTIATRFDVQNTTLSVINPFGGALYIILPDGSNFGAVDLQFSNAVKSPYFSSKTGFENSLTDYQADLENDYVNWVDIESDNFMCTFPKSLANAATDAEAILTPFNTMIGQYNVVGGRPLTKIRSEYIISEPQLYSQGTYPASYPMSIPNGDLDEVDLEAIPISVLNPTSFMASYDGTTILHEL
ncbi:MAG: M60 family peptidase N-terminal accessory domain-containing protein, partial [Chitinophagales bacterium]